MRGYLFVLLALVSGPGWARVYQWVDPDSGNVYLSGSPPAWYRAGAAGPRVFVYESGELVDDTARSITREEAQALRDQAVADDQRRREDLTRQREAEARARAEEVGEAQAGEAEMTDEERTQAQLRAAQADYEEALRSYFRSIVLDNLPLLRDAAAPGAPPPQAPAAR
jgi:hypothetical protein